MENVRKNACERWRVNYCRVTQVKNLVEGAMEAFQALYAPVLQVSGCIVIAGALPAMVVVRLRIIVPPTFLVTNGAQV